MTLERNSKEIYLLIDFNASRRYSHHWTYLNSYRILLEQANKNYEIWIPKNADDEILSFSGSSIRKYLRSNAYGYERRQNFFYWFANNIFNFILRLFEKYLNSYSKEKFRKIVSWFYLYNSYKRVRNLYIKKFTIHLVFTTADSLALRLIEICLRRNILLEQVVIRTMGVNFKDNLAINDPNLFYRKLIQDYPECKIVLGFETIPYKMELINFGIDLNRIFWSPVPSIRRKLNSARVNQHFTIGFLGTARPNKGFEAIPLLVKHLIAENLQFKAVIQEAIYPWPNYFKALNELKSVPEYVEILPANISTSELENLMMNIDTVILPYNVYDYKIAGSGLLFAASDFNVPVIATKGVAFEWDINQYSLGYTYANINEFLDSIKKVKDKLGTYDFHQYNFARNKAIKTFLGI
jgi:hypothetical protein